MILEQHVESTDLGDYRIELLQDEDGSEPDWDGIGLYRPGTREYVEATRGQLSDVIAPHAADLIERAIGNQHGEDRPRSRAAIVRYARLSGAKGFTLIDERFRPEPHWGCTNPYYVTWGAAWADHTAVGILRYAEWPDDEARNMVVSDLQGWHAWAEGDVFGVRVVAPNDETVEDSEVWGYYGLERDRGYVLREARATIAADVQRATDEREDQVRQSNQAGAGLIGLI